MRVSLSLFLRVWLLATFAFLGQGNMAFAQETPPKKEEKPVEKKQDKDQDKEESNSEDADTTPAKDDKKKEKPKFKEYSDVITDKMITKSGLWTTHQLDGKVYYELSPENMGKDYLWIVQYAKVQSNFGYGGTEVQRRIVRFERIDDTILLRNVEYQLRAEENTPEALAVEASSLNNIIAAYKIITFGEGEKPVIDVTDFFQGDVHEFSPKVGLDAAALDKSRTFITSVKTFEKNIETKVLATYKLKPKPPTRGGSSDTPLNRDQSLGSVTVELHHSVIQLPENPMRPRYADKRIGFFRGSHADFSSDKGEMETITLIRRWRLEKQNPNAKMSEPKNPIVFYVGRGVPEKFKSYVKAGIEAWQPAFEQAGFKNAILGKYPPSMEENPDWDAEDVRFSTIRWLASSIPNAYGPHVQDPRTGEILEADVRMFHNVQQLVRNLYFVQNSPSDKTARSLPLSDERMGLLIQYVVTHEVGHSLGFRHNMQSTNSYPVEKYRDPKFVKEYGLEPSIMDYGRFNYIAQPGDNVESLPIVGPYDKFAVEWGYSEFKNSQSAEDDIPFLNKIAERQTKDPMLRFGGAHEDGYDGRADHRAQTEDLGDDAVKATRYGLKNLQTIMGYLIDATTTKNEDYSLLSQIYSTVVGQMRTELGHVANVVGSIEYNRLMAGQKGTPYKPLEKAPQLEALQFLQENAFQTPTFLLDKDVIERLGMQRVSTLIKSMQQRTLSTLLSRERLDRMFMVEATGYDTMKATDLIFATQNDLFKELAVRNPKIDAYRRNLQRHYVDVMLDYIVDGDVGTSDVPALARMAMSDLQKTLRQHTRDSGVTVETAHLLNLSRTIQDAFDGKREKKPAAPGTSRRYSEWPDYVIESISDTQ